jgi:hypothetical protein
MLLFCYVFYIVVCLLGPFSWIECSGRKELCINYKDEKKLIEKDEKTEYKTDWVRSIQCECSPYNISSGNKEKTALSEGNCIFVFR